MLRRNQSARTSPYFRALCTSAELVGRWVYSSGPKVGDLHQVRLADPSDETKMPIVGLVVKKLSETECIVQSHGRVEGVFSGLAIGRYNGWEDGEMDPLAPPVGLYGYAWVQAVGNALSDDVFYANPSMDITIRKA